MTRLDKILSQSGIGTRTECEKLIKKGFVAVNSETIKKPDAKIEEDSEITVCGEIIEMPRKIVCIMNKPSGYVCSTDDPRDRTVIELLPEALKRQKVIPAGRLDKDTEGLLVLTNDGDLIHKLISPKHNVSKTYYVEHEGSVTDSDIKTARNGIVLKDGTACKSAVISALSEEKSTITITEGMYHQVKRMYAGLGHHVTFLKRISIGEINLEGLETGQTRELTDPEIAKLLSK